MNEVEISQSLFTQRVNRQIDIANIGIEASVGFPEPLASGPRRHCPKKGEYLRRKIQLKGRMEVNGGDFGATSLHFECPKTVGCTHVESAPPCQIVRKAIVRE